MDVGGITSWFTLGERRAGVKVAHQRGPGPGTALEHRIAGAGGPDVLGRDLVSPRGRWESPGVGRGGRERGVKRRGERSQTMRGKRRSRVPALKTIHFRETLCLDPPHKPRCHRGLPLVMQATPLGGGDLVGQVNPPTHPVTAAVGPPPPTLPTHCCSALARSLRKKSAVARKNMPPRTTTKGQSMRA